MSGDMFAMAVADFGEAGWFVSLLEQVSDNVVAEDSVARAPEDALQQVVGAAPRLREVVAHVREAVAGLVPTSGSVRAFALTAGSVDGQWAVKVEMGQGVQHRVITVEHTLLREALQAVLRSASELGLDLAWLLRLLTLPASA